MKHNQDPFGDEYFALPSSLEPSADDLLAIEEGFSPIPEPKIIESSLGNKTDIENDSNHQEVSVIDEDMPGLSNDAYPLPDFGGQSGACVNLSDKEKQHFFDFRNPNDRKKAISTCKECPVRIDCLKFALRHNIQADIYGGFTPRGRDNIAQTLEISSTPLDKIVLRMDTGAKY